MVHIAELKFRSHDVQKPVSIEMADVDSRLNPEDEQLVRTRDDIPVYTGKQLADAYT